MNTILSLLLVISMGIIQNKLPFAGIGKLTSAAQGTVVFVGKETVNVDVGATVLRNVGVALPLTVEQIHNRDIVALVWNKDVPFVTNVLGHETALRYDPLEDTEPPPAPINVRVVQGSFGVRLEWDWGGTNPAKRDLSYYEVDARLPGGDWGYNTYPVSEGTRELHYSNAGAAVQCRVRAVDFRGNESAWVVSSDLLRDSIAPPAPDGFAVENTESGILASWTGPTTETVADLAAYNLYMTLDSDSTDTGWTGTPTKVAAVAADTTSITYDMNPGVVGYFNLTAVDTSGNESDFALRTWVAGQRMQTGAQILTNADLEYGDADADEIYGWHFSWGDYSPLYPSTFDYGDGYGWLGSRGIYGTGGVSVECEFDVHLQWPDDFANIQVPGIEGQIYVASLYTKGYPLSNHTEWGVSLLAHNGTAFYSGSPQWGMPMEFGGYESLEDGWVRLWWYGTWNSPDTGYDYIGVGFYNYQGRPTPFPESYLDRPQLQVGRIPTPWSPSTLVIPDYTLRIDGTAIIGSDLTIAGNGTFESNLEPAADATYDVGGDNNWRKVRLADGITAPTGTSGDALLFVDTSDDLLKVRHGTDTPISLEEQGADPIDSYIDDTDGVGIGTTWTTVCSQSITVPTGYRAFLSGMACVYADGTAVAQTIHFRIYDGTTSWQQYDRLGGTGGAVQAGLSCLTLKTGTYTVYLDIMKGTSDNTIYCTDNRAYLTVLIFPEKT